MESWKILKELQEGKEIDFIPIAGEMPRKLRLCEGQYVEIKNEEDSWVPAFDFDFHTFLKIKPVDGSTHLYFFD